MPASFPPEAHFQTVLTAFTCPMIFATSRRDIAIGLRTLFESMRYSLSDDPLFMITITRFTCLFLVMHVPLYSPCSHAARVRKGKMRRAAAIYSRRSRVSSRERGDARHKQLHTDRILMRDHKKVRIRAYATASTASRARET